MPLAEKTEELQRLIKAFEAEASRFHPTTFSLEYLSDQSPGFSRPIALKHHGILLWQFYGSLNDGSDTEQFANTVASSNLKWGIPGAQVSCLGIIEGEQFELFVRMATRAGALFDEAEATEIKIRVVQEIVDSERARNPSAKAVTTTNSNPLAVWLNYLLYHLSQTNPGRERARRIDPDPFALSLLALERLLSVGSLGKMEATMSRLADIRFRVALSFPGEQRTYVSQVAHNLQSRLGKDSVFYDYDYQAHLARPNLDVLLQNIYRRQSELLVVFVCEKYSEKEWCGLEWRAIRDLIKSKKDDQVMFIRFDGANLDGLFSIDGYIDGRSHTPEQVGELILQRLSAAGRGDA